ncbi:MAG: hypothetical protein KatS3mg077_2172 [Candidatus Binatia bacterium]|nr:MAG: hypothetical protein KatS3mg077_2172 [Candidatus Binatia bacterium]
MRRSSLLFFPLALPFILALLLVFLLLVALLQIGLISIAYEKLGIPPQHLFSLLLLSLLGSYINIPVGRVPAGERMIEAVTIRRFGVTYVVPRAVVPQTVIAVNVGGAVVPVLLSLYLIARTGELFAAVLGTAIVAAVVHRMARPLPGLGIAMPMLIPPLLAAVVGIVLSSEHEPAIAYVSGTLGTLVGADLLNLRKVAGLGAPVASIGGAGTFDGIFLTGILAVLLA